MARPAVALNEERATLVLPLNALDNAVLAAVTDLRSGAGLEGDFDRVVRSYLRHLAQEIATIDSRPVQSVFGVKVRLEPDEARVLERIQADPSIVIRLGLLDIARRITALPITLAGLEPAPVEALTHSFAAVRLEDVQ